MEKQEGPASLQAFAEELEQYEKLIAEEAKSLPKEQKRKGGFRTRLELTAAERQKASLIQYFIFPSDAQSMIGALLYISSQTDALASQKPDRKTWYWMQLWKERAGQLYEKVKILAGVDSPAYQAYAKILRNERKIKQSARLRIFLPGGLILAVLCTWFFLLPGTDRSEEVKPEAVEPTQADQTEKNQHPPLAVEHFTFSIPRYWKENGSRSDYYQFYAETDGRVAMLSIGCPVDEEPVTLDALYADNENMIEVMQSWFPECQVTGYEDFESDYGVKGILYSYKAVFESEGSRYGMSGKSFCFPSVEDNRWFFVVLNTTDNTRFQYDEDFMEMLASIRQTIH